MAARSGFSSSWPNESSAGLQFRWHDDGVEPIALDHESCLRESVRERTTQGHKQAMLVEIAELEQRRWRPEFGRGRPRPASPCVSRRAIACESPVTLLCWRVRRIHLSAWRLVLLSAGLAGRHLSASQSLLVVLDCDRAAAGRDPAARVLPKLFNWRGRSVCCPARHGKVSCSPTFAEFSGAWARSTGFSTPCTATAGCRSRWPCWC